jgi:hypothetical protein
LVLILKYSKIRELLILIFAKKKRKRIKEIAGFGYFKTIKELMVFIKESTVLQPILKNFHVFENHIYISNIVL